jgi:hypothetical protein
MKSISRSSRMGVGLEAKSFTSGKYILFTNIIMDARWDNNEYLV